MRRHRRCAAVLTLAVCRCLLQTAVTPRGAAVGCPDPRHPPAEGGPVVSTAARGLTSGSGQRAGMGSNVRSLADALGPGEDRRRQRDGRFAATGCVRMLACRRATWSRLMSRGLTAFNAGRMWSRNSRWSRSLSTPSCAASRTPERSDRRTRPGWSAVLSWPCAVAGWRRDAGTGHRTRAPQNFRRRGGGAFNQFLAEGGRATVILDSGFTWMPRDQIDTTAEFDQDQTAAAERRISAGLAALVIC